jgi:hypothetical protein
MGNIVVYSDASAAYSYYVSIDQSGNVVPTGTTNTQTLGYPDHRWRDVYVGPGSLNILSPNGSNTATLGADNNGIAYTESGFSTPFINLGPEVSAEAGLLGGWRIDASNLNATTGLYTDLYATQIDDSGNLQNTPISLLANKTTVYQDANAGVKFVYLYTLSNDEYYSLELSNNLFDVYLFYPPEPRSSNHKINISGIKFSNGSPSNGQNIRIIFNNDITDSIIYLHNQDLRLNTSTGLVTDSIPLWITTNSNSQSVKYQGCLTFIYIGGILNVGIVGDISSGWVLVSNTG